ncbi:MAG TPA: TetR/AcrR family transcriptional regulator [Vicinamibacterales bacterium]|nr:TetR/AcrR family transcriptional regulator [Vicinamibacterales bacterium]
MPRPARISPDRILAAAALEFSERGWAGARVDRIARRARVNKAMLYYHFGSKQGIYRTLLRHTFGTIAARLDAIAASRRPPADTLDAAIETLAAFIEEHAFFPSIMLREVAEGGAHLDPETLAALAAVPRAFAAILTPGIEQGAFRRMHPLAAYFTTVAPILMFVASTPVRQRLSAKKLLARQPTLTRDRFLADLKQSLRRAFAASSTA